MKSFLLGTFFSAVTFIAVAQNKDQYKFFKFNYQNLPSIQASPQLENPTRPDYESNRNVDAQLRFPVVLKNNLLIIGQLRYQTEDLHLGYTNQNTEHELNLHNTGITFFFKTRLKDEQSFFGHLSTNIRAQQVNFNSLGRKLDYSGSLIHVFEKSPRKSFGYGLALANTLGRLRISPVALYQNQWHKNWEIEFKLPKMARLSWFMNSNTNGYLMLDGNSANYFLDDIPLLNDQPVEFRRLTLDLQMGFEQAINEWVWMGFSAGITQPLRSRLVESGLPSRYLVHRFNSTITPTFNVYLFTVVPQRIINKFKK